MFIKDGKRFNIYQRYIDPDTGEKGIDMTRPENRERFGVTEIPDPVRESDETHYNQEIEEAPYLICTPKSPAQLERLADDKAFAQAKQHLADTDYLFTVDRHAMLVKEEASREAVLAVSREAAREAIRNYKAKYPTLP